MTNNRTINQMRNRCQLGNMAANYQLYARRLPRPFENKPKCQTDYNLFVQSNYGHGPVFLTHRQVLSGACVLAPYLFSRGSLPTIAYSLDAYGLLVSDLSLGELVIGELTTVGQLSQALIDNNADWREGDELWLLSAVQIIDPYLDEPRARMNSCRLVLDTTDTELLRNIVLPSGFASIANENHPSTGSGQENENGGYRLGMANPLENAGAAWVHSRKRADGGHRVSTQFLFVVSDILADYTSDEVFERSAESYGAKPA